MKIHVNKLSAAFVFAALASTASFSQTKVWTVSSVIPQNTKSAGNLQSFCLNKNSGAWEVIEKCNVDLQGYELIYADPIKRIFQLASPKPSRISERPGSVGGECFYGVFGTSSREKNGYNICNSALAKGGTNVGEAVIGNIVNLAMGTVRKIMVVDQDAVLKAATEAGLQKLAYQKAFTDLTNITVLKNLIDVYKDDDGSGLIPQAQERLKKFGACTRSL